jgi:hypothetical protein
MSIESSESADDSKSLDSVQSTLDDVMQYSLSPTPHRLSRPSLSYTTLIANAIRDSPNGKLLLCDIYAHIMSHHAYYQFADPGWKVSHCPN